MQTSVNSPHFSALHVQQTHFHTLLEWFVIPDCKVAEFVLQTTLELACQSWNPEQKQTNIAFIEWAFGLND